MIWHGWWTPWGRHFIAVLHKYLFAVYVMLYFPHSDFFNMIHLWAIAQHVKYTFLDCFYTHLQLQRAISVLIFLSSHLFCLHMFLTDSGWCDMAWQMMSLPLLGGILWMWSKYYFLPYVYFCISPKTFFQHHEFGGNCKPYNMFIPLWLLYKFSCIHAYMCLHFDIFTYFCLGMLGIHCRCGDMAWQIKPLISDWRLQWQFRQVDITLRIWHCMKLTFMSHVWVLLYFWAYFTTFGCTISYSLYIYHCFIHMCYMSLTSLSNIECNHDHCNSSLWHLFVLHISVIVCVNFHSLYMLCLHSTYGS